MWDSSVTSPSSAKGAFWSVQEFTTGGGGGSDQSTIWNLLADPQPSFVGANNGDAECTGGWCTVHVPPPAGAQPGDLLLASLDLSAVSSSSPSLPTGWNILPISNIGNGTTTQMQSNDRCGDLISSWFVAHVLQVGETSFDFKHFDNGENTCTGFVQGELGAYMVAYRGANPDLTKLTLYGYPTTADSDIFTIPAVSPPAKTTLVSIFSGPGSETPSRGANDENYVTINAPTGNPTLTVEDPQNLIFSLGFLGADIEVRQSSTAYGAYTVGQTSPTCSGNGCVWFGWQVAVPSP